MIPTDGNSEAAPTIWQRLGHWIGPIVAIGAFLAAAALLYRKLGGDAWPAIGMCVLLSAAYVVLAAGFLGHFERVARERASFALS